VAEIIITSFFTRGGTPAGDITDLNPHSDGNDYPRVRVWDVTGGAQDLVIGDTIGSGQATDGIMLSVTDNSIEDGFYTFVFDDTMGFDDSKRYLIRSDGGPSLPSGERYQVVRVDPQELSVVDIDAISDGIWNEPATDHLTPGSTGLALNQTKANAEQLVIDVSAIDVLISTILKYETNRTKIDPVNKELIIYDDDCTTILRRFELYDSAGNQSTDEVCERVPVQSTDGLPVCP